MCSVASDTQKTILNCKVNTNLINRVNMNRFKFMVGPDSQQQQQIAFDRTLTNRIKKFSSARNLFFANIYSHSTGSAPVNQRKSISTDKPPSRLEKTKSFCSGGLLKKCKSLRDLYQKRNEKSPMDDANKTKSSFKHMDEFERNYLFSAGKKDLVRELRKNFESGQQTEIPVNSITDTNRRATYRKCDFSDIDDMDGPLSSVFPDPNPKRNLSPCHSFRENESCTSILQHELEEEHTRKSCAKPSPNGFTNTLPQMSNWTRSEMDLSSLARPPLPNNQLIGSRSMQNDPGGTNYGQRNHHQSRTNDGDTMSLCDMSLYPIYMGNINDNNNLVGGQNTDQADSGISLNNNNVLEHKPEYETHATNVSSVNNSLPVGVNRLKKFSSVNQIDLEVLKNELDDFVDISWNLSSVYHHRSTSSLVSSVRRKELDLEQKIDLEIKMREGSAKLLAACNNPKSTSSSSSSSSSSYATTKSSMHSSSATSPHNTQMLEAAKSLLTSNERMSAYMAELQRRKKERDTIKSKSTRPSGKVSLSEIRMPLMWRDTDHFKNKGDHRRFAVFCLAKIGTEIYDTSLLCPVDRNSTDISFNDAILFTNVHPDFELKLEIYSVMMVSDLSIASTPQKIKNTIHSSISRTVGKRLAANLKDELNNSKIGPKFELIASTTLSLDEASDLPHTHDLTIVPSTSSSSSSQTATNTLPLFGHLCCRLAVQPDSIETTSCSGELTIQAKCPLRSVEGFARLQAFRLDLWEDETSCEQNNPPRRTIEVIRDAKVKHRNTVDVLLHVMEEGIVEEYTLHANSETEALRWYAALKKTIREHAQWGHVTVDNLMQLAAPANFRHTFLRPNSVGRQRSLYDQVPILEYNRQSVRHTSHDLFAVPNSVDTSPTLNDFRLRTNSSSGRSSTHSSSISIGSSCSRKQSLDLRK